MLRREVLTKPTWQQIRILALSQPQRVLADRLANEAAAADVLES
jgi:hypothetical protein